MPRVRGVTSFAGSCPFMGLASISGKAGKSWTKFEKVWTSVFFLKKVSDKVWTRWTKFGQAIFFLKSLGQSLDKMHKVWTSDFFF
jgi:hypothetical protein